MARRILYWLIRGFHHVLWGLQAPLDHLEWLCQEWEFQAYKRANFEDALAGGEQP